MRGSPQYVRYQIKDPSNLTISELAIPFFVLVPLGPTLSLDVGTAYASAHVDHMTTSGTQTSDTIVSGSDSLAMIPSDRKNSRMLALMNGR